MKLERLLVIVFNKCPPGKEFLYYVSFESGQVQTDL